MSSSQADGSEDVNDFLQRIKELGDRRDQEDEERNRKLEEEILQGRKERQARRAERARSISPTKSSPANTPTASRHSEFKSSDTSQVLSRTIGPEQELEPRRDTALDNTMDPLTASPTKENSSAISEGDRDPTDPSLKRINSIRASPSSAVTSRNSPLSWQRRPNSQASERPRSRPLSMVATENAARSPRGTPEPSSNSPTEPALSRDQIAQSLASKDPNWFRQSADSRGGSSPAYRKNQVEDEDRSDHGSKSARVQMPGMSSRSDKTPRDGTDRAVSPSRSSTGLGISSTSSGLGSPLPLTSAQRLDPPNMDSMSETRGLAMSPSQGRISPDRLDRPASPTKGMGGFVQSAMMKRSDSVSKRWSVQSPPGLSRGNSIASNRTSFDPSTPLALGNVANSSVAGSRPSSMSRDGSPRPLSRPTSSHSNTRITQEGRPGTGNSIGNIIPVSTSNDVFVKPALPVSRSQTPQDARLIKEQTTKGDKDHEVCRRIETTPPASPSRTMDPKRWSPTKSSWLESALNKPESPKPKPAPPPQQPAWMSEISKAKQKESVNSSRAPTAAPKHEVSIGGLLRSPPPGGMTKAISIGSLPTGVSSSTASKSRSESISSQISKSFPGKEESATAPTATPATTIRPSPTSGKTKPETPPKKDFRSNLKPRQLPVDSAKEEPEFKNIFGQLRRTKTQNYVAPDELKNNITRGKAALNLTGGPKKTERKDEFKDAILKKKEDFKKAQLEGNGVTRSASGDSQNSPIPEALAKRKALGRPDSSVLHSETQPAAPITTTIRNPQKPSLQLKENSAPGRLQGTEAIGGKLAGRFNPALAGLLARGPPSMASDTSRSSSPISSQRTVSMSTSTTNADTPEPGPQLTHMTKGRARGPRRKAPSAALEVITTLEEPRENQFGNPNYVFLPKVTSPIKTPRPTNPTQCVTDSETLKDSENQISQPSSPRKLDLKRRSQFLQEAPNISNKGEPLLDSLQPVSSTKKTNAIEIPVKVEEPAYEIRLLPNTKAKPNTPIKSPSLTSKTMDVPQSETPETAKARPSPLSPKKVNNANALLVEYTSVPIQSKVTESESTKVPETSTSVKNVATLWDRPPSTQTTMNPPRSRSPIKLPTYIDEKAAMVSAGLRSPSPVKDKSSIGLSLNITRNFASSGPLPTPPVKSPTSTPLSLGSLYATSKKSNNSPVTQASDASKLVTEFFKPHSSPPEFVADTAEILSARPDEGHTIKTLRSSLYQFSADGKKQLVPNHRERLLFEENMYICFHTFGNTAGKKVTVVYFWVGDEVSPTTVSGAQIFAQREAKGAGGSLIKIVQGKETPEFFIALGGIIVVRRGSSNKYDSLAPHILCGRKHSGQIAFDEVDYSASSLCSGFPYLISTQSGKSYLWKGKGSGIDELSCARLIGMDFGLTGEIEEVEDGSEPIAFLKIFGSNSKIPKSADHWRMKPNYSKYCVRLFCADSNAKSQIVEVAPFNQSDVSPSSISILDAFFEMYIIVGSQAQSQYSAFHNALMFAQEYAILAAGMEDRPYIPVTTIVLEGIPKDMKSVFRKWSDDLTPTILQPLSPGLQRGRSLRVVPLTAALEATRRA